MQQWHDSDTYEGEQFSGEEDFGEILVAQNSGGIPGVDKTLGRPWPTLWPTLWPTGGQTFKT